MGETAMVAKMVLILGLLFIFVAALFPGQETPWTAFQSGVQGASFPTFDNPFSQHAYKISLTPDANATGTDYASATGCVLATYWKCVANDDGAVSYLTLNANHSLLNVHMTNLSGAGLQIISAVLLVNCRTNGVVVWNNWHMDGGLSERVIPICSSNSTFQTTSVNFVQVQSYAWDGLIGCGLGSLCDAINNGGAEGALLDAANSTGTVDITYMEFDIYVIQASSCNNGNAFTTTACQLGKIVDTLVKFGQFVFNGIIFVGTVFFYLTATALSIVTGFFSIASLLFAVPGAPDLVQKMFSATVMSFIVIILLVFVKILRGIGGGG